MGREKDTHKKFTIRIQISLMFFLLLALIAIAAIIYVPLQFMSIDNTDKLVADINREILTGVRNEVVRIFDKAILTQDIIRDTFADKIVDLDDRKLKEEYCFALLKANPNFTWISIGYPSGVFFGVQRETDKQQINIINNSWDAKTQTGIRDKDIYRLENGAYTFQASTSFRNDYNALDRPWYKKAVQEITDIWTDVYIFDTTKKPGINSAVALSIDGIMTGIISVAFELEDISLYLKNLKIGKTGTGFIIDSKLQVMATQNTEDLVYATTDAPLKKLNELDNPFLTVAYNVLSAEKLDVTKIKGNVTYSHHDPKTAQSYYVTFMPANHLDWTIATVIPAADYLAEIQQNSIILLGVVGGAVLLVIIFVILLSKRIIVRPILRITDQLVHVQNFNLDKIVPVPSRIREIKILSTAIKQMTLGLLSFGKYIPTELVQQMISEGIQAELGGQEKELSILFTDLVGFTGILEKYGNTLIPQLGEYMNEISEIFIREKGSIDKYIGDAIMAFWGAPVKNEDHAKDACKAALDAQKALEKLRIVWEKDGKPPLTTRVGINTGVVLVGNVGSGKRLNYTVVGDPVNLASRLEGLNKVYKTSILIGQSTYRKTMEHIIARKVDSVLVYGKSEREDIYELIAMRDDLHVTDNFDWIKVYERAHSLYQDRHFTAAIEEFKKVPGMKGREDYPSQLMIFYCAKFLKVPPPVNWKGVSIMKSK